MSWEEFHQAGQAYAAYLRARAAYLARLQAQAYAARHRSGGWVVRLRPRSSRSIDRDGPGSGK